jgi:hypothetical protein
MSIQTPLKNSQLQLGKMDVNVGRKELKSDAGELNQFLKTDDSQPVSGVIFTKLNTIPAKVTSFYETI